MKTGVELIASERESQINKHGYTANHDDEHDHGQLTTIAATLCVLGTNSTVVDGHNLWGTGSDPWGLETKLAHDPIHRLKVAGALIAAEIDRLQRKGIVSTDTDQ